MLKYVIYHSSLFTAFIFLLIASVLGHLIYFLGLINIIDCLISTPHTCTIKFLYLIHPNLALDLVNQVTKIGDHRLALSFL
jgi:hypothetical protein